MMLMAVRKDTDLSIEHIDELVNGHAVIYAVW